MTAEESVHNRSNLVSIYLQFTYMCIVYYTAVLFINSSYIASRYVQSVISHFLQSTDYYKQFCFFKIRQFLSTIYACRMFVVDIKQKKLIVEQISSFDLKIVNDVFGEL